jgi:serine/threonine protein kinase/DNA-binding LacI/PurR family transcriptional regulator
MFIVSVCHLGNQIAMSDSMIGKKVGEFIVEERLGQGAMAVVYKAFESSINRHVALKVIRLDEGQQGEFRRRFAREAEVIARLEHIHILPIYAYGINEEMAFLAMRWLKGGSLSELLKHERMPLERIASIFKQIAEGLAFAHSNGIIHRDLKPSNIMLDDGGNAYLTDFGLAKLAEGSGELTRSGTIVGTPAYMSPEQLRGEPLDHRSDIYSMGVILYNMAAGRLPFDTTTSDLVSIIYQHLEKPPIPPSEFNPSIPAAVEQVILRALQKDRNNRFNSAVEMSKALNAALGLPPGSSDNLEPLPAAHFINSQAGSTIAGRKNWQRGIAPLGVAVIAVLILIGALIVVQTTNTNNQVAALQTSEAQTVSAQSILLNQTATASAWTPSPPLAATVLTGVSEPSSKIVPNSETIGIVQNKLGTTGFVAYIACTQDTEYHAGLAREITDVARRFSINYRLYDSQADAYREVTLVEKARAEGASALIICPLDINLLRASLRSAQAAGVPLVFHADNIPTYGGVMVGGDAYLLGLVPGQFAGKLVRDEMNGQANVIILDYPDRADIVTRANGLEDGLKEFAPEAKVIGRYLGATREFGKESVEKLLKDGVDFNMILSINDAGAFGAIEAMKAANIDPKSVQIVSIDAEALAQDYIRKGYFMRGSVQSSRVETAQALMDAAIQLLAGGTLPQTLLVPPGDMVTKETLEQGETATPTP